MTTETQSLPTLKVYAKVNQKLAMWEVTELDPAKAIQMVKEVAQIKTAVLALIK